MHTLRRVYQYTVSVHIIDCAQEQYGIIISAGSLNNLQTLVAKIIDQPESNIIITNIDIHMDDEDF